MSSALTPIEIFCSYAQKDESLLQELEVHLSALKRQGLIATLHDLKIPAGTDKTQAMDTQLELASVILLLVSPNFLASDYCYQIQENGVYKWNIQNTRDARNVCPPVHASA